MTFAILKVFHKHWSKNMRSFFGQAFYLVFEGKIYVIRDAPCIVLCG